ncbi:MAG: glycerate kinase family protein [Acidimicrobiales bacterium]
MRIVAAPDKFKGTASAADVAAAIGRAANAAGVECAEVPLADGGEGTLDVLGGSNRVSTVTGPLGHPVDAAWRLDRTGAVIEMAQAAGLTLAGGPEANDPLVATTRGVGELILEAVEAGAPEIIVGVGGSATTDGGLGAVEVIGSSARLRGTRIIVACDVRTRFLEAARVFGPQKGATRAQVSFLSRRLHQLAERYEDEFGVAVGGLDRSGAAGGLAGGLAALGAELVDGFEVIAERVNLPDQLVGADLVVTGEGFLDRESFSGKVVGGVAGLARSADVPVLAIAGQVFDGADGHIDAVSLTERFGLERALTDPVGCVFEVVESLVP